MSDETNPEAPTAELPVAEPQVPTVGQASGAEASASAVAAPALGAAALSSHGARPVTWGAALAATLVLALVLSGVSFGAGVFVGRQTGQFDRARGARGAMAVGGYGERQGRPNRGAPGGGRMLPRRQGIPGQDMPGGRGFRGSPNDTTTAPPAVN